MPLPFHHVFSLSPQVYVHLKGTKVEISLFDIYIELRQQLLLGSELSGATSYLLLPIHYGIFPS